MSENTSHPANVIHPPDVIHPQEAFHTADSPRPATTMDLGAPKVLEIVGTGYRAELQGEKLVLHLGYSHPIEFEAPTDISFEVPRGGRSVVVHGIDKEMVGEIAARIRRQRPPEPYKGKGVRYRGEYVRRKAGKAGRVGQA